LQGTNTLAYLTRATIMMKNMFVKIGISFYQRTLQLKNFFPDAKVIKLFFSGADAPVK
jgi:hypothetical protein